MSILNRANTLKINKTSNKFIDSKEMFTVGYKVDKVDKRDNKCVKIATLCREKKLFMKTLS